MQSARRTSKPDVLQSVAEGMTSRPSVHSQLSLNGQTIDGFSAGMPLVSHIPVPEAGSDIARADWNNLFNAVKGRLIRSVRTPDTSPLQQADMHTERVRTVVLECVTALDQLQATVTAEFTRGEGLELAVFDTKASLAQIRAALLGTQAGECVAFHLGAHDGWTLLHDRAALIDQITQQLVQSESDQHSFAVMFLDLEGFKSINDMHGRASGDALLEIIAARLRRVVRPRDLVCRVGADEFACLIGGLTDQASLAHFADKMADVASAPCVLGPFRLAVQAHIGIALCPFDGDTAKSLLDHADLAMVAAKRRKLSHMFFSRDGEGS